MGDLNKVKGIICVANNDDGVSRLGRATAEIIAAGTRAARRRVNERAKATMPPRPLPAAHSNLTAPADSLDIYVMSKSITPHTYNKYNPRLSTSSRP